MTPYLWTQVNKSTSFLTKQRVDMWLSWDPHNNRNLETGRTEKNKNLDIKQTWLHFDASQPVNNFGCWREHVAVQWQYSLFTQSTTCQVTCHTLTLTFSDWTFIKVEASYNGPASSIRVKSRGDGNEVGVPVPSLLGLSWALWSSGLLKGKASADLLTGGRAE